MKISVQKSCTLINTIYPETHFKLFLLTFCFILFQYNYLRSLLHAVFFLIFMISFLSWCNLIQSSSKSKMILTTAKKSFTLGNWLSPTKKSKKRKRRDLSFSFLNLWGHEHFFVCEKSLVSIFNLKRLNSTG